MWDNGAWSFTGPAEWTPEGLTCAAAVKLQQQHVMQLIMDHNAELSLPAWLQVWDNGAWSFTGPAEWTPEGFNHTWFYPLPAKAQVRHFHAIMSCFAPDASSDRS